MMSLVPQVIKNSKIVNKECIVLRTARRSGRIDKYMAGKMDIGSIGRKESLASVYPKPRVKGK